MKITRPDRTLLYGRYKMEEYLISAHAIEILPEDVKTYQVKGFNDAKYVSDKFDSRGARH